MQSTMVCPLRQWGWGMLMGLVLGGGVLTMPRQGSAQEEEAEKVVQSLSDNVKDVLVRTIALTAALAADGYHLAHIEVDRLRKGEIYVFTRKFYAGNTYRIAGIGGEGIRDLDIYVYDESGSLVAKDTQTDAVPTVSFSVEKTEKYRIKVGSKWFSIRQRRGGPGPMRPCLRSLSGSSEGGFK